MALFMVLETIVHNILFLKNITINKINTILLILKSD